MTPSRPRIIRVANRNLFETEPVECWLFLPHELEIRYLPWLIVQLLNVHCDLYPNHNAKSVMAMLKIALTGDDP